MNVPLLDLKAQYATVKATVDAAVLEVLASQYFILGPTVTACEAKLAAYCHSPYALGVSSGTDALLLALMAESIGPGDEVITSPYTFFATGGSIARLGAKPVFVDIDPVTYNIDPAAVGAAITPQTRAIMPVHLYGQMAEMAPLVELAQRHKLVIVEDAAQAIGAEYRGSRAGTFGTYGCFSFFPSKNLGGGGDGGLITTADKARAERLEILRVHGSKPKYLHRYIGGNFRLDAMQAAIVAAKLPHLDGWTAGRQANAARYDQLFTACGLVQDGLVTLPAIAPRRRHVFNQYVIRVPRRDALRAHLTANQVGNEVYYPVPLHRQECFAQLGYEAGSLPESERAAAESLALPIYPELTVAQQEFVVTTIAAFLRG
jgi:dTDP-4-amino-4,6-dideoxygalactose transaminase